MAAQPQSKHGAEICALVPLLPPHPRAASQLGRLQGGALVTHSWKAEKAVMGGAGGKDLGEERKGKPVSRAF